MSNVKNCLVALVAFSITTSIAMAQCVVDDSTFSTEDGGCKDLATDLVWSADLRAIHDNPYATAAFPPSVYCDYLDYNGFTDWRVPTLGEIEETLANGLNEHLDFFLDGGATPDDTYYRATICNKKVKGARMHYAIRFTDGDVRLTNGASEINPIVCVRGTTDPTIDCPGKEKGGGGNGKNAMLLPRSATGALLLSPLWMMALVCGAKRRIA